MLPITETLDGQRQGNPAALMFLMSFTVILHGLADVGRR